LPGRGVAALVLFIRNHVDAIGVSVAVTVLFGIAAVCYGSSGQTLFQSMSADAHRGRVLGVWGSAVLMTLLGMLIASTLGSYFLAATILDLAVILLLAASVLSAAVLDDNSERRHAEGTSS
jgi:MFS family permease